MVFFSDLIEVVVIPRLLLLKSKLENDCFVSTITNHNDKKLLLINIQNATKREFGTYLSTSESSQKRSQDSPIWNVTTTHLSNRRPPFSTRTKVIGPAASPRGQEYVIYYDRKGHPRAFFNMAADLIYEGSYFFRQRLVLATHSGKLVKIKNIRAVEDDPGLKGASIIELIKKITAFSAADFSCKKLI